LDSASRAELSARDVKHLIHPNTNLSEHAQVGPKIFVRGEGAILTDIEGKSYIDGFACLWNVTLGHGRKDLAEAAATQMTTVAFTHMFAGFSHVPGIELATRLASLTPGSLDHFHFTSGGSESNETAFKIARFYWKLRGEADRVKVIARRNGYHGLTWAALSATGIGTFHKIFDPLAPGFVHIGAPYCYRCEWGRSYPGCNLECAQALDETIQREKPETVAAFIAEPVIGTGGVVVPPPEYFPKIREICDKYGVLWIDDEVVTGFCRTAKYWGAQNWPAVPDMMTMAKAITSGYFPFGGVAMNDKIYQQLIAAPADLPFMHGYTYSGHTTGCAVALATLDAYDREGMLGAVNKKGALLAQELAGLKELPAVGDVRGIGLLGAVELVRDKKTKEQFAPTTKGAAAVAAAALKRGLIVRATINGLVVAPPYVITEDEIRRLASILRESILEVASDLLV
jgi:putrescine aminotransferase